MNAHTRYTFRSLKWLLAPLFLLCALCGSALADQVTLKNYEADRLLATLLQLPSGLSPANIRNVALDINALRPVVEAYGKGVTDLTTKNQKLDQKDKDYTAKHDALNDEAKVLQNQPNKLELVTFDLTDDEVKDAKLTGTQVSDLFMFLTPAKPKK